VDALGHAASIVEGRAPRNPYTFPMRRPSLLPFGLALALFPPAVAGADAQAAPRIIEVVAKDFAFEPATIEIGEGETVALHVRAADGRKHGIQVKELGVKAEIPKTGEVVSVTVVGRKPGTFVVACSVYCGKGHSRMKGRLVVTPKKP
jgi:cytochrome c oxidase subunit 2